MTPISFQGLLPSRELSFEGVSADNTREFLGRQEDVLAVTNKLIAVMNQPPVPLPGYLNDTQIPEEIFDPHVRKYLVLTFNQLVQENAFEILNLPETNLFVYEGEGNWSAHRRIYELVKEYMHSTGSSFHNYNTVVHYLKALKNRRLSDLTIVALEEKKKRLEWLVSVSKEKIQEEHARCAPLLAIAKRFVYDYPPGDFSFIPCEETRNCLLHTYQAIGGAHMWLFFDREDINTLARACNANKVIRTKVMDIVRAEHVQTGWNLFSTMLNMMEIRKKGWEKFVSRWLEAVRIELLKKQETFPVLHLTGVYI